MLKFEIMTKLILATTSPHRKTIFDTLGLEYVAQGSDVDEYFEGRPENPADLVKELSRLKAESVAKRFSEGIVLAFDSVGFFDGEILEKPKSKEDAFQRLKSLSGETHYFFTGIHMINLEARTTLSDAIITEIEMRNISESEITKYLGQNNRYLTMALGYDPLESFSSSFVCKVEGDYNNITRGIPVARVMKMLKEIGYKI